MLKNTINSILMSQIPNSITLWLSLLKIIMLIWGKILLELRRNQAKTIMKTMSLRVFQRVKLVWQWVELLLIKNLTNNWRVMIMKMISLIVFKTQNLLVLKVQLHAFYVNNKFQNLNLKTISTFARKWLSLRPQGEMTQKNRINKVRNTLL